jgi:hypothetical protein
VVTALGFVVTTLGFFAGVVTGGCRACLGLTKLRDGSRVISETFAVGAIAFDCASARALGQAFASKKHESAANRRLWTLLRPIVSTNHRF